MKLLERLFDIFRRNDEGYLDDDWDAGVVMDYVRPGERIKHDDASTGSETPVRR